MNVLRFTFIFLSLTFISQISFSANHHQVNNGTNKLITEHGICRRVTNSCGNHIFVPTKTASEWSTFRSNKPACASVTGCPVNGGWSAWSSPAFVHGWHNNGAAATLQTRTCTNPAPANGGANCSGASSQVRSNCYSYTLTRTGGTGTVRARILSAGAGYGTYVSAGASAKSGKVCYTGTLNIELLKNTSTATSSSLNINGTVRTFPVGAGDSFLNTWWRKYNNFF